MPITIEENWLRDLMLDPVMAAAAVMGETRLDAFQRAMLRYMWFCPVSMDSSGQGSGKTFVMFIYLNLRAAMLPDHYVIYLPPTLDQGERMFWKKYYDDYYLQPGQAPVFVDQLRRVRGSTVGTMNREGFKMRMFKNGSRVLMIPPNISKEGASAAGEDCNTIGIEEWGRLADTDKGLMALDGQFASRWRRPAKNPNHPVWGNHIHFSGHAEEPSHPSSARYEQYAKRIREGSLEHAQFTFCHRDFSPATRKRVVNETAWEDEKHTAPELYKRKYLGLRASGIDQFYPEVFFTSAQRTDLVPECVRNKVWGNDCEYFGGQDYAGGFSAKADFSAHVVLRMRYVTQQYLAAFAQSGQPNCGFIRAGKHIVEVACVWAARFKALRPTELAGMIHWLHMRYGYTSITSDPKGGGKLIYSEVNQPRALINGDWQQVVPICTTYHARPDRLPIWQFFEINDTGTGMPGPFSDLPHTGPNWLKNEAGLTAAHHNQLRKRLGERACAFIAPPDHFTRSRESVQVWDSGMLDAAKGLSIMRSEMLNVGQLRKNGQVKVSVVGGYPMFGARGGKKDIAMAFLYAWAGLEKRLHELSKESAQDEEGDEVA